MSGFIAVYGSLPDKDIEKMSGAIEHRGPHASGVFRKGAFTLFQNYLRADVGQGLSGAENAEVPVRGTGGAVIGFDGQLEAVDRLLDRSGVEPGAFVQERALLSLFEREELQPAAFPVDGIFSVVLSDGTRLLAARDLLGIKTLFYGLKNGTLVLASELKALALITDDVHEFPPGHTMDESGNMVKFAELPDHPPGQLRQDAGDLVRVVREIIERRFTQLVDFSVPTASLLSGGLDSSVIAHLATVGRRKKAARDGRLKTFSIGIGESEDIRAARLVSKHLDTDHTELLIDLDQMLQVLPEVIYNLESFDPSLVRSSVSNYLVSRAAKERGVEILLSGEGGDETFCGYSYLKQVPKDQLFAGQIECFRFLHNNASLRLDRMNLCHSIRVIAPLISGELFNIALRIPNEYKLRPEDGTLIEKWIFRKAFEPFLPNEIAWRLKQEFSQGSGSASVLPSYFEQNVSDRDFESARSEYPFIRSKEEYHYFRLFTESFGSGAAVDTVGQWISL